MNHCTPEGAATFERERYRDFQHPGRSPEDDKQKQGRSELDYFNEHYVSPSALKKVLDQKVYLDDKDDRTCQEIYLSDLHICLAHFGGPTKVGKAWSQQIIEMIESKKYPNLYTDISSSFADDGFRDYFREMIEKHPAIKNRVLFGTDWFLTLNYSNVPPVSKDYWDFCVETKTFLDSFNTSLWPTFTQYNPYRFYQLGHKIKNLATNIITTRRDNDTARILGSLKKATEKEILKEADYIQAVGLLFADQ